jgi:hypothetical protein
MVETSPHPRIWGVDRLEPFTYSLSPPPQFIMIATSTLRKIAYGTLTMTGGLLASHAASITNGSFEDPSIASGTYVNYGAGSTDITGWTVVGLLNSVVESSVVDRGITFSAQSGNQWLDLTGPGPNLNGNGITQALSTIMGQSYQLSFYVGSATDGVYYFPSTVDLSINGGSRISFTNTNSPTDLLDWQLFTSNFTASSAITDITFFHGGSTANHVAALDNVSITTIPEPSSFACLLGGALILCHRARRR